ncbi:putative phosphoglycerate mutase DET1 [Hordeum vulgare]|nr:putative phosphoglycerate mutase DET1 [Hordeum vulgare]
MSSSPRETAAASQGEGGKESCPFCEMSKQHAAGCARRLPKRIILVRHGESQGNLDMSAYSTTPDYRIPLTPRGVEQARAAGRGILDVVSSGAPDANWKVYFYVSPYERTRATLRGIGAAFPRHRVIGAREECRVREQDFGNFQVEERMRAIKETRERFGRFFFRFPEGESAADVFDRVASKPTPRFPFRFHRRFSLFSASHGSTNRTEPADRNAGFLESLWRDIDNGRLDPSTTCETNLVIVSHGLTSRVFMMKWFKWTVEQFERLNNFENCEFRVMQLGPGGEYSLLMHHTKEELEAWGLSPEMITDQQWRASANRRSWSEECSSFIATFFDNWNDPPEGEEETDDDRQQEGDAKIESLE